MKTAVRCAVAALLAGCVVAMPVGAPASVAQALPQASHTAFVLFEFDIRDQAAFKDLAAKVRATLKDFKGDFVTREKVASPFGGSPSNLSVISFPSVEDARKWLASPDLAKLRAERDRVASVRTYIVEKVD